MTLAKVNLLCFLVFLHKIDPLPPFQMDPHAFITNLFFVLRRILSSTELYVFFLDGLAKIPHFMSYKKNVPEFIETENLK